MAPSDRRPPRDERCALPRTPPPTRPALVLKTSTRSSPKKISAELNKVIQRLDKMVRHLDEAGLLADSALTESRDLLARYADGEGGHEGSDLRRIRQILSRDLCWQSRLMAANGTADFQMKVMDDGAATLFVEGKKTRLSPTLASLLTVLAGEAGPVTDHLVPWKSLTEIASELSLQLGRDMRAGALRQNISRLRARLASGGIDRFLVQTNGSRARFALRRRETPGDSPSRRARHGELERSDDHGSSLAP
jgi:hypothetical protein